MHTANYVVALATLLLCVTGTARAEGTTPTDVAAPPPATMFFRAAGAAASPDNQVQIVKKMSFCPLRDLGTSDFTVYCTPSTTSTKAVFRINSTKVGKDTTAPYYIAGDVDGVPNAWTDAPMGVPFTFVCNLGGGIKSKVFKVLIDCPPTVVEPTPEASPAADGCVIIQARDTALSTGWVADHVDGVTFNAGNRSKELTRGGVSPLYYTFTAPVTSQFGVAIDMTTRGRADFNDVYLMFPDKGWQLMRAGIATFVDRWIKGYQSMWTRGAWTASAVDHKPQSIATAKVLQAGEEYQIAISGRSNDVTVHRILMFPCAGDGCDRKKWRATQERCVPGSTMYTPRPRANRST